MSSLCLTIAKKVSRAAGAIATEGLLRRLRYLRDGEIVGGAVLAGVFCWLWATSGNDVGWALRLTALLPL